MLILPTTYFGPISWYRQLNAADTCYLDACEPFRKRTFRNRCEIATPNGRQTLTVPVEHKAPLSSPDSNLVPPYLRTPAPRNVITSLRISEHNKWRHVHWQALETAYGNSPFFDYYVDDIRPFFEPQWEYLFDLNLAIIRKMCELLQIEAVVLKGNENVLRSEERGAGSENTVKAPDSGAETNLAPSYLRTSAPSKSNLAPPYPRTPAPPKKLFVPLKTLLPFSLKIMAANLITILNNNILTVLLGRLFNEREVGFYNQAAKWNQMGFSVIQGMIVSVAQPVMRQVESDRERLLRVFRKMLRFASFVSFPCMFGLALVAPELITIAITDKWLPSARLMQMVCIGGAFLPLHQLMYQLLVSKGRSDVCLWSTIVFGLVQLATVLACSPWGITTMVMAFVGVNIGWTLVWWWLVRRQTQLALWPFLQDVAPFAAIAAASIMAAAWASSFVQNIYLSLAVKVVVAAALYILAMQLLRVATFREALTYLRKRNTA